MEKYITISERLKRLKDGNTLTLAIEGRFTNLVIWTGKDANGKHEPSTHDTIYMRLDRANQYNATLSEETFKYLDNAETPVKDLVQFGFKSSIENLAEILEITKSMKYRELVEW